MEKFNGYSSWNNWNVALWINNDEGLYNSANKFFNKNDIENSAKAFVDFLKGDIQMRDLRSVCTQDGAIIDVESIKEYFETKALDC